MNFCPRPAWTKTLFDPEYHLIIVLNAGSVWMHPSTLKAHILAGPCGQKAKSQPTMWVSLMCADWACRSKWIRKQSQWWCNYSCNSVNDGLSLKRSFPERSLVTQHEMAPVSEGFIQLLRHFICLQTAISLHQDMDINKLYVCQVRTFLTC